MKDEDENPQLTKLVEKIKKIDCKKQYIKSVLKKGKSEQTHCYIILADKIENVANEDKLDRVTDKDKKHSFILTGRNIKIDNDCIKEIEIYKQTEFCPAVYYWNFIIMDNKEEVEKEILACSISGGDYKTHIISKI